MHSDSTPEIPFGYCHCGCGQKAPIATHTYTRLGILKGEPFRFINGHYALTRKVTDPGPNPSGLCQCGCGERTGIARWSSTEKGNVGGTPVRFLPGHAQRLLRKTERIHRHTSGYILEYRPDHPHAQRDGFVYQHRLVMESMIGRLLLPEEVVHHIDGNEANNDPTNLELFADNRSHMQHHRETGRWSKSHESCIGCGTTDRKHNAKGLCVSCYVRQGRKNAA